MNEAFSYNEDINGVGLFKAFRSDARTPNFTLPDAILKIEAADKSSQLIKRIEKRLNEQKDKNGKVISKAFDPLKSDLFNLTLGDRRKVSQPRVLALRAILLPLLKMADTLTGVLPYSNVTTLSDQCDLTTFGQAFYDKFGEKLLDEYGKPRFLLQEGEQASKKKSVSRLSRLLNWLEDCGYIKRHYLQDETTGANLPLIVQLTDKYYHLCGENATLLYNTRSRSIRYRVLKKQLPLELVGKTVGEVVEAMREIKIKEISEQRQEYRAKRREGNKIAAMDALELRMYAGKIVKRTYGDELTSLWNEDQFSHKIDQQIDRLFKKTSQQHSDIEPVFDSMLH
jgi:hypothetical protein